jgi:predicted MFS family arabinose efflux permease
MVPWFSYYFTLKFGVNLAEIGLVFAVSQMGMAIAFLLVPKMAEKIGCVRTIVYSQATAILVLLLISVSPSFPVASILYLVRVILMNMTGPAFSSFFMGLLRSEERASGNSLIWASWNIGNALPRPVAGYIMGNIFLDMTLYICASLYSISTVIFYGIFRKEEDT